MLGRYIENNQFKRSGLFCIFLCLVLCACITIPEPVSAEIGAQTEVQMGETLKVGLKYGSNAVSQCKLTCDGGFCVANYSEDGSMPILQRIASNSITVLASNGIISIIDNSTDEVLLEGVISQNVILPLFYSEGYIMTVDGAHYRGGFSFPSKSANSFEIINIINVDQYVYGVLPSEIGASSPIEAIKAQAVAARSYAIVAAKKGGSHTSNGFDLCTTTHCQVYKGADSEKATTNQATDETAGQCIYHNGEVVMAYYAKNSGGYTQDVSDVWGSKLGYLKAVPDPYSTEYKWEKTYNFSEIEDLLEKDGKGVGSIKSIEITSRTQNYNVKEITITGSSGIQVLKGTAFRTLLGATNLKSTMFAFDGQITTVTVDKDGNVKSGGTVTTSSSTSTSQNVFQKLYMLAKNGVSKIVGNSTIYVIGEDGSSKQLNQQICYITGSDGSIHQVGFSENIVEDTYDKIGDKAVGANADGTYTITRVVGNEKITSGKLKIVGLGYGHGIGLQQDGAIAMGKLGFDYKDILHFYYSDIEIK